MQLLKYKAVRDDEKTFEVNKISEIEKSILECQNNDVIELNNFYKLSAEDIQNFIIGFMEATNKKTYEVCYRNGLVNFEIEINKLSVFFTVSRVIISDFLYFFSAMVKSIIYYDNYLRIVLLDGTKIFIM